MFSPAGQAALQGTLQLAAVLAVLAALIALASEGLRLGANLFTAELVLFVTTLLTLVRMVYRIHREEMHVPLKKGDRRA